MIHVFYLSKTLRVGELLVVFVGHAVEFQEPMLVPFIDFDLPGPEFACFRIPGEYSFGLRAHCRCSNGTATCFARSELVTAHAYARASR